MWLKPLANCTELPDRLRYTSVTHLKISRWDQEVQTRAWIIYRSAEKRLRLWVLLDNRVVCRVRSKKSRTCKADIVSNLIPAPQFITGTEPRPIIAFVFNKIKDGALYSVRKRAINLASFRIKVIFIQTNVKKPTQRLGAEPEH
jgi:hypothetical protein